ncbi:MAG: hypothetical protein Q8O40_13135 [Chloroflexota bacterium]|nr:hypothetical protein [Chloroflexota bacterium]
MDLLCQRCGEPYDQYHVRHEMTPQERNTFLDGKGCPSCIGKKDVKPINDRGREAQAALRSVLGDDLDALAAEMEDFGLT